MHTERGHAFSDLQSSLHFSQVRGRRSGLERASQESLHWEVCKCSLIYSSPLSGMLFAGWSSGVLTRLLALTCCQDGLQTSVCVCVGGCQCTLGAGKQEVTNVPPGRPLAWRRTGRHGHVNITEAWTLSSHTHTYTHTHWSDLSETLCPFHTKAATEETCLFAIGMNGSWQIFRLCNSSPHWCHTLRLEQVNSGYYSYHGIIKVNLQLDTYCSFVTERATSYIMLQQI